MNNPIFSYEFFPPRTQLGERRFWRTLGRLEAQEAAFFSITYGALGSGQSQSLETVEHASKECDTPIAAHLTFEGSTKEEINAVARRYRDAGVDRIVALRGDARAESEAASKRGACYKDVPEFINGLLEIHPFDISVACYPDVHPKAKNLQTDLQALKEKLDAGANRAISQFFFDTDDFERFRDQAAAHGIDAPIVAGVLPIRDFNKVVSFAEKCGTRVPQSLIEMFAPIADDGDAMSRMSQHQMDTFIDRLIEKDCHHFHIYTLNQMVNVKRCSQRLMANSVMPLGLSA